MSNETGNCENCHYWITESDTDEVGRCVRHPPVLIPTRTTDNSTWWEQPITCFEDMCGEFRLG